MLDGPYLAAAALLVVTAVPKLADPNPTAGALRSVGWPSTTLVVWTIAIGEILTGTAGLLVDHLASAVAVAGVYLGFSVFLVTALRSGGKVSSCGCVGKPDRPPTGTHLALNMAATAVALVAAFSQPPAFTTYLTLEGWPILLFAGLTTWLAYEALALLPVKA